MRKRVCRACGHRRRVGRAIVGQDTLAHVADQRALDAISAFVATRSGERDAIARFVLSLGVIGPLVFAPAMIAVLGFGIWMVIDTDAWDFGQTWIWLALSLFGAAFLAGAVFQGRAAIGTRRAGRGGRRSRSCPPAPALVMGHGADLAPGRRRHLGHGVQARLLVCVRGRCD